MRFWSLVAAFEYCDNPFLIWGRKRERERERVRVRKPSELEGRRKLASIRFGRL